MRAWLAASDDPSLSKRARLREVKTHVVGPMCHVLWRVDDRRRGRPEHDDPQLLRAEHGLRHAARAGEARARDPRGEHGRRQEAVGRVLPVGPRQDGAGRGVPLRRADPARPAHDGRRPRGAFLGGHARLGGQRDAVGRLHARLCDRRDLRGHGPGSGHGRHELDGAGNRTAGRGRAARVDPLRRARGRHGRRRHDAAVGARMARVDRLRRLRQRLPLRADRRRSGALPRDQRVGRDGDRGQRELLPGAPRTRRA